LRAHSALPNDNSFTAVRMLPLATAHTVAPMLDRTSLVDDVLVQTTVSKRKTTPGQ
jgi:hypothetical protein